jgi:type I restriction enzyme S subunit
MVSRDWITVPLGKIATLQRGYDLPHRLRRPGEVPIITSSGIGGTHSEAMVSGPGVVTGRYGTIGEVFYIESDIWPLNTTLFVRDFHGNDPLFVSYLLRTIDFQTHSGKSGVPGVNRNDLHEIVISIPPTQAEQEAIAEALSDADALIESLEQLIVKKRQIKQGAMQELLTGKKRLLGFETKSGYKQPEVEVIPEDWEAKSLGSISMIATGNTPPTRNIANYGDEFLFVSPVDLGSSKYISHTEKMLSQKGFAISRPFPKGSILFVCIGSTIGKCGIALETLTSNQQINAILPSADFSSEYLYYAVSMVAPKVKSLAGEQAVPIVNKTQFSETVIPLPPTKAEQEAIAAILSDMDAEITALEEKLAKARQLKQGMMQELLTGRIRLV